MSYSVYYRGELDVTPPLKPEDAILLPLLFDCSIREARALDVFADQLPAEIRALIEKISIDLPLQVSSPELIDTDGNEEGYSYADDAADALRLLITDFFTPRGYTLNGQISWDGDGQSDSGVIWVDCDKVEAIEDDHDNPGPSWDRKAGSPAPCGHSSQYAYTEDGGQHIVCLVCERDGKGALLGTLREVNKYFEQMRPQTQHGTEADRIRRLVATMLNAYNPATTDNEPAAH